MASQSMGVNKDAKNRHRFREQVASKYIFPGTIRVENDPQPCYPMAFHVEAQANKW